MAKQGWVSEQTAVRPRRPIAAGADRALRQTTVRAFRVTEAQGAARYDRAIALPRMIGLDPRDVRGRGAELDAEIVARLERALRAERRRGKSRSWTYDLNRHLALSQALAAETSRRDHKSTSG